MIESKIPAWEELSDFVKNGFEVVARNEHFIDYEFSIGSGSNVGDGFMSVMIKVYITGTRLIDGIATPNQELKVVCKMPPTTPERREMQRSYEAFKREIDLYTIHLPFLDEYQDAKGITGEDRFVNFPKCYYGKVDESTKDALIIMEDLRDAGYSMAVKTEPMSYEYCRLVLEAFGKLHGLSLAVQNEHPIWFDKFRYGLNDFMHLIMLDEPMGPVWDMSFKSALGYLNDDEVDLKAALVGLKENLRANMLDLSVNNSCYPFGVIGHGDSWVNNFMFQRSKSGVPTEVSLIDWQITRYGSPVLDLSYFLFTSTDKALRDKYLYQLLGIYYDTLCSTIDRAGLDGRSLFPFEELQRQLKSFGKYGVLMSIMLVPFLSVPNNEIPDLDVEIKEWKEKGVEDSQMMEFLKPRGDQTAQRVADNIRDGRRLGML